MAKKVVLEPGFCFGNYDCAASECDVCVANYTCKIEAERISNLKSEKVFYRVPSKIQNWNKFIKIINEKFPAHKMRELSETAKVHRFFDEETKNYLFQIIVTGSYEILLTKADGTKLEYNLSEVEEDFDDLMVKVSEFLNTPL